MTKGLLIYDKIFAHFLIYTRKPFLKHMTLQLLPPSEFPYIGGKLIFISASISCCFRLTPSDLSLRIRRLSNWREAGPGLGRRTLQQLAALIHNSELMKRRRAMSLWQGPPPVLRSAHSRGVGVIGWSGNVAGGCSAGCFQPSVAPSFEAVECWHYRSTIFLGCQC